MSDAHQSITFRHALKSRGLSQAQFARKIRASESTISKLACGLTPGDDLRKRVVRALGGENPWA